MNIDDITIGDAKKLVSMLSEQSPDVKAVNPFIGRRVLVRTYSSGVHIGTLVSADEMTAHLIDALRLWKWTGGGLSLSAVATNGIKGGRLNRTPEIFLTNAIEIIPTTKVAERSYVNFIED